MSIVEPYPNLPSYCVDYRGRTIVFSEYALRHILHRHPAIGPYLPEICEVLTYPDYVFTRPVRNTHIYCKEGILPEEFPRYFTVYVQYNDGGGRGIATAFPSESLPTDEYQIYPR